MKQRWVTQGLRVSLIGVAIAGVEAMTTFGSAAFAQLVEDSSLGTEASLIVPVSPLEFGITGGARRGANLFHSFREFNVPSNGGIYFLNPVGVTNILTRVTGQNLSNIDGVLGVLGNANLFFMNPNGIIFGRNARLQVNGSFVATTANAMQFGDRGFFSASAPSAPSPLLTVNPSALVFNQLNQGAIVNRSRSPLGATPGGFDLYGLGVPAGQSMALVGGDVRLEGGGIRADGGRVELGGLSTPGQIALQVQPDGIALQFPATGDRAHVSLTDSALVSVAGAGGGSVTINANTINLTDGSTIRGGIETGATAQRPGGDIVLNAQSTIQLDGSNPSISGLNTQINNNVRPDSSGDAGNIVLNGNAVSLTNGAQVRSVIFGVGNSGKIEIAAPGSVRLDKSSLGTGAAPEGRGNGGLIQIEAGSLAMINQAEIDATTLGQGNGGTVVIQTMGAVELMNDGSGASRILTGVAEGGQGRAGDILITAASLVLRKALLDAGVAGLNLDTGEVGQGQAGRISLIIRGPVVIGAGADRISGISSSLGFAATGQAGTITLRAGSLTLKRGAISSSAFGLGNAGNITIQAVDEIELSQASQISSGVLTPSGFAQAIGTGGDIRIQARTLTATEGSSITSQLKAEGNAGNLSITVDTLKLNQSSLVTSVAGGGQAGTIHIEARNGVTLTDKSTIQSILTSGIGQGGDITIQAENLALSNLAVIGSPTEGQGTAGNIQLRVRDRISVDNSFIVSGVGQTGQDKGGDILINTDFLTLRNNAALTALTNGPGNAGNILIQAGKLVSLTGPRLSGISTESTSSGTPGNIIITAPRIEIEDKSTINSSSNSVNGGNIILNLRNLLLLRNGGNITTNAGTAQQGGNGGNITINIPRGFIVGFKPENSDITANAFTGSGGRVNITAQGIFGLEFRPQLTEFSDITASSTFGASGVVTLNLPTVDPNRGLVQLPQSLIDTDRILANSCMMRDPATGAMFLVTGTGGLPLRPGDLPVPAFPTGDVQGVEKAEGLPPNPPRGHLPPNPPKGSGAEGRSRIQNHPHRRSGGNLSAPRWPDYP